jgi:hypothetical protein
LDFDNRNPGWNTPTEEKLDSENRNLKVGIWIRKVEPKSRSLKKLNFIIRFITEKKTLKIMWTKQKLESWFYNRNLKVCGLIVSTKKTTALITAVTQDTRL